MNNIVQSRVRIEALSAGYTIPAVLAANTVVLFALEQLGVIPGWIKTVAAIFLAF